MEQFVILLVVIGLAALIGQLGKKRKIADEMVRGLEKQIMTFATQETQEAIANGAILGFKDSIVPHSSTYKKAKELLHSQIEKQRYNSPGYYMASNGEYVNGIPYKTAAKLICKSKLHDLYHQANHNIKFSPHTYIGKARGYINPMKVYYG